MPRHATSELQSELSELLADYRKFALARDKALGARLASRLGGRPLADALLEELGHPGKFLRPALTLASYSVFSGGRPPTPECFAAAHALEVFHAFVLVHDDVIDRSDHRRSRPTLHRRLEKKPGTAPRTSANLAIVLGDILFGHAIGLLSEPELDQSIVTPLQRYLAEITEDTGLGESLELTYLDKSLSEVSVEQIEEVYYLKTTRYTIEAPLWLGGRAAGKAPDDLAPLAAFARPIGLGFQLENDLHEMALPKEEFIRSAYDLQTGVKTLFLRRLYDDLPADGKEHLNDLLTRCADQPNALNEIYRMIQSTSTLHTLQTESDTYFRSAREWIPDSPFPENIRAGLHGIADLVFARRKHSEGTKDCG